MKDIYCYKNNYGGKIKINDGWTRAVKDDTMNIDVLDSNTVSFRGGDVTVDILLDDDQIEFDDAPGVKFSGTALELQDKLMEYFFGNANSSSGGTGTLKEVVPFTNVSELDVPWNAGRIERFGGSGIFYVEILGDDDQYHYQLVEGLADDIDNTSNYHFDFGAVVSGRITII